MTPAVEQVHAAMAARLAAMAGAFHDKPPITRRRVVKDEMRRLEWMRSFGIDRPRDMFVAEVALRLVAVDAPQVLPGRWRVADLLRRMSPTGETVLNEIGRLRAAAGALDDPLRAKMVARVTHYWQGPVMPTAEQLLFVLNYDGGGATDTARIAAIISAALASDTAPA